MNANDRSNFSIQSLIALALIVCLAVMSPARVSAQTFNDVPTDYWAFSFIEDLAASGITAGCGSGNYCPENPVTRAQMAVFLERGMRGSDFSPPTATDNVFLDVAAGDFAASFIEQLFLDGITAGCGGNNYCPNDAVTRAQMAVFLLRAKHGAGFIPPPATGVFTDVPLGSFAVVWIEQLAAEGITGGCGGGNYCPGDPVTRAQMAVFLVRTFELTASSGVLPSYTRISSPPFEFNTIIATADFSGDGLEDLLVGSDIQFEPGPLMLLLSNGDGTFRDGTLEVMMDDVSVLGPIGITADFNGDGSVDVAVFTEQFHNHGGTGGPPVLLLGGGGSLNVSNALADAVAAYYVQRGSPELGSDLHARDISAGDIDNDGDVDLFVESCGGGGDLVCTHFIINNGDGTFTIDFDNRVTNEALHGSSQEDFWRSQSNALVDLDNDGDLDLVVGQGRSEDPEHVDGRSLVFLNNGAGYFPIEDRILLPLPAFNEGLTTVTSAIAPDINGDGFADLVFAHHGTGGEFTGEFDLTGRFIQILINQGSGAFGDETSARMGSQTDTTQKESAIYGGALINEVQHLAYADVNLDGYPDLIMGKSTYVSFEAPLVHINDGTGHFTVMDPEIFTNGDLFDAENALPVDVNVDGLLDFVILDELPGPDGVYGTDDEPVVEVTSLIGALE